MNKIISFLTAIMLTFILAISVSALTSGNIEKGAKIFAANCNGCHLNGGNVVKTDRSLKKEALEKNGSFTLKAIQAYVTNGKGSMPAFKGRLNSKQITDVSAYVIDKAKKGWKNSN